MQTAKIIKERKPIDGYFTQDEASRSVSASYKVELEPPFTSLGGSLVQNNASPYGMLWVTPLDEGKYQLFFGAVQSSYEELNEFDVVVRLNSSAGQGMVFQDLNLHFVKR